MCCGIERIPILHSTLIRLYVLEFLTSVVGVIILARTGPDDPVFPDSCGSQYGCQPIVCKDEPEDVWKEDHGEIYFFCMHTCHTTGIYRYA